MIAIHRNSLWLDAGRSCRHALPILQQLTQALLDVVGFDARRAIALWRRRTWRRGTRCRGRRAMPLLPAAGLGLITSHGSPWRRRLRLPLLTQGLALAQQPSRRNLARQLADQHGQRQRDPDKGEDVPWRDTGPRRGSRGLGRGDGSRGLRRGDGSWRRRHVAGNGRGRLIAETLALWRLFAVEGRRRRRHRRGLEERARGVARGGLGGGGDRHCPDRGIVRLRCGGRRGSRRRRFGPRGCSGYGLRPRRRRLARLGAFGAEIPTATIAGALQPVIPVLPLGRR